MPEISAKFDQGHPLRGRRMQVGWVKIGVKISRWRKLICYRCFTVFWLKSLLPMLSSIRAYVSIASLTRSVWINFATGLQHFGQSCFCVSYWINIAVRWKFNQNAKRHHHHFPLLGLIPSWHGQLDLHRHTSERTINERTISHSHLLKQDERSLLS